MAADVALGTSPPEQTRTDYLALFQWMPRPSPAVRAVDRASGGLLSRMAKEERFEGQEGRRLEFVSPAGPAKRVGLFGLGKARSGFAGLEHLRRAAGRAALRARECGASEAALAVEGLGLPPADGARAAAEGALLATYRFSRYSTERKEERGDPRISILVAPARRRRCGAALDRARAVAEATGFARDLVNEPAGSRPPRKMAEAAQRMAKEHGLACEVLDERQIQKLGMEGLLAVSRGSEEPPRFIHVAYRPRGAKRRVVLAGKGITFDSGGLDLKTADGMLRMKYDMAGGAAVLGAMKGVALLKPKVEVHGLVPSAENMPGSRAYKPGDVVRPMGGKTVEIGNTDAEGRVVLADALGYATQKLKPDEIIDVATLTGAAAIAVGKLAAALFTDDEPLAKGLLAAAGRAGEYVWRLPLYEEYKEQIKGDIADLKNVGDREGGAITAALFLKEFAGDAKWAHLDIAGAAFTEKEMPYAPKGGTGFAVRTLLEYLAPTNARR